MVLFARSAARNPRTDPAALARLARSGNADVVESVGQNPSTPPAALSALAMSASERTLVAVAANPSTPAAALQDLAHHRSEAVKEAVASNPATPDSALEDLIKARGASGRILVAVAGNSGASATTLLRVSTAKSAEQAAIRKALAGNKATPTVTRALLFGMEGFQEIVRRTPPAEPVETRIKLAEQPPYNQVAPVLALLAHDQDEDVRRAVAISRQAGADVLDLLARDSASRVADVARARRTPDPSELATLSLSDDGKVLAAVAMNPNTPADVKPEMARRLAPAANAETSRLLAQDEATPADVLQGLATHPSAWVRRTVASNKATPPEVMSILTSAAEAEIRAVVASDPRLPLENLVTLATDLESKVRAAVAGNPSTPPAILIRLAADSDVEVVMGVVRNEGATSDVLQQVVARHGEKRLEQDGVERIILGGDLLAEVAKNPNTPPAALETLADSRNTVRAAVAGNPSTPPGVLDELARTVHEHVWHKGSPDMQRVTAEGERVRILDAIVRNPASTLGTLRFLSRGDWAARCTTKRSEREDGHTTTWTIWDPKATEAAQKDKANWVLGEISKRQWRSSADIKDRLAFASDGHTSSDILDELAQDTDETVRRAVAANPSTRQGAFLRLAGDPVHDVRLAAASASHPPAASNQFHLLDAYYQDAFELLATDEDADVRAAVVENSQVFWRVVSAQTRERLVFDTAPEVQASLARSYLARDKIGLFRDPLSVQAYTRLVDLGDPDVWRAIAHDFRTPPEILERLLDLGDAESTAAVVGRLDSGSESLVRLAGSAVPSVVAAVLARRDLMNTTSVTKVLAESAVTSPTELERLARYAKDEETVASAVRNPNFPEVSLVQFASGSDERFLRAAAASGKLDAAKVLAANPLAPADVLAELARYGDSQVRGALLVNAATPPEVLVRLVQAGEARNP